ncbi:Oidioi.mRNA.OKI2018_I69.chr1.g2554.t1.cds [Oikopleura dioica]|uniref:Oidioi.mRNA.OKI2018_I69.chr1.g2554.t1.cds n=1 Tax=Oikopleura dioica TaxID=34765 RepID=A0ABN7SVP2_OIKDI|nr:Oidioi.mRNA.OKI2018_I69.chr1.g2554.t1.cds [Oikopleura dioica]
MDENSLIFGLESASRELCPVVGDADVVRFLAVTQNPTGGNSISLLTFDEDDNQVTRFQFMTKAEHWRVSSCPQDVAKFATVSQEISKSEDGKYTSVAKANVFILNEDISNFNEQSQKALDPALQFKVDHLANLTWKPEESSTQGLAMVSNTSLFVLEDLEQENPELIAKTRGMNGPVAWDPHNPSSVVAAAVGHSARAYDVRSKALAWEVGHRFNVRDLDFNPNKSFQLALGRSESPNLKFQTLALGADDGGVKFYDTRKAANPVKTIQGVHTHWTWQVKFNPVHDQLFLTSGGDGSVYLHSITSISSEPFGSMIEEESTKKIDDGVILKFDEHEDAVYSCQWSTANPWLFASLSHDGRMVINQVPKSVKYDILL